MDDNSVDLFAHLKAQVLEKKDEINLYYAELNLKLPSDVKNLTLKEIKALGGTYYPSIYLPKEAMDKLKGTSRMKINLEEKIANIFELERNRIISYYRTIKEGLPDEILQTKLCNLDPQTRGAMLGNL